MGNTPTGSTPAASPQQLSSSQQIDLQKLVLARRLQAGANWFYWITGLSIVNSVMTLTGANWRFIVGLGVTQVIDAVTREAKIGLAAPFAFDVLASGVFILFGVQANRRRNWAFLAGMIFYAMDGLLLVLFKDVLGIGFHLYALYCIYRGMKANEQLETLERGILA